MNRTKIEFLTMRTSAKVNALQNLAQEPNSRFAASVVEAPLLDSATGQVLAVSAPGSPGQVAYK